MSDLAKKCADKFREYAGWHDSETRAIEDRALAAFIEAAQAVRDRASMVARGVSEREVLLDFVAQHDAALRDLAQSMEVE